MKRFLILICAAIGTVIVVIFALYFYVFGEFTDPSIEFGYFGGFHRTQRVIQEIEGSSIHDSWMNKDITIEDYGFTVTIGDGPEKRIDFWENSPQNKLKRDEDIRTFVIDTYKAAEIEGAALATP